MTLTNNKGEQSNCPEFKVYPKRWLVLITVALLNMSNGSIWIGFFPVASITANYFEKSSKAINWLSFVFMLIPLLCFGITTYLSHHKGLRFLVHTGSAFNFCGAALKALATSGLFVDKNTQYIVTMIGQCTAAVAQTFSIYTPTKVSHIWFPSVERGIATSILALSYSLGVTITQVVSPVIVKDESDIPELNYICCAVASLVQIMTVGFVTSSYPKTPPSETAGKDMEYRNSYGQQLKDVFSTSSFVFLLSMLSCGIGIIAGLNTLTQQVLCSVGYSNEYAGSCIAIMYLSGYIGAAIIMTIINKFGITVTLLKMAMAVTSFAFILLCEVILIPGVAGVIGLMYALFGLSSTGMFPLNLEMTVESTYPADESLTTGLTYFFGQIFAIVMIILVPSLATEASSSEHNVCGLEADQTPLDYSISVSVIMVIFVCFFMAGIIFYKPVFKRRDFEQSRMNKA